MAGLYSKPTSSRSGSRRESFEGTHREELFAFDKEFIQLLRQLPDYLMRLQSESNRLQKEAKASPSRLDSSSKRTDRWLKERWEAKEKQLIKEQEERIFQLRKHHEQQLKNGTEILQQNNTKLQNLVKQSLEKASQKEDENKVLKQKLREYENQLQERVHSGRRYSRDTERLAYEKQMMKTKQALEEKRRELDRIKERHAAFSERRVRSDQRKTEDTLSTNRQSQLESDYVIEFKDGTRVDAIDIITSRTGRLRGSKANAMEYLKCCRLACFIFEVAFEVVLNVKEAFTQFTATVMETLATEAPAIGSDNTTFQLWKLQYNHPRDSVCATQDAITEVMILVKEEAKTHDLNGLVEDVTRSISAKWARHHLQREQLLLEYDWHLLYSLKDYVRYCTQFAWCAVTQVPPLKIDYQTAVYSSKSHTVSQAFSSSEERSPNRRSIYSESRNIMCYLWPTLMDCDGKVIRKGEVILTP